MEKEEFISIYGIVAYQKLEDLNFLLKGVDSNINELDSEILRAIIFNTI